MQDEIAGRVLNIRIDKAKGTQKSFAKVRDCHADIGMAIVEDVALLPLYVYGRLLLGEFTSKVVAEETRFPFQKTCQSFTRIQRPDGLTYPRRANNHKARSVAFRDVGIFDIITEVVDSLLHVLILLEKVKWCRVFRAEDVAHLALFEEGTLLGFPVLGVRCKRPIVILIRGNEEWLKTGIIWSP